MFEVQQWNIEDWIPNEIKLFVFSLLDSDSLFSISTVCKSWNEISLDTLLWEIHFHKHFPNVSPFLIPSYPYDFRQLFEQEQMFLKRAKVKTCARDQRTKFMRPETLSSRISNLINIKMTLLGDAYTGKTSFLLRYVNQQFSPDYYLTSDEDMYTCLASLGGRRVNMLLCDIPGTKGGVSDDPTVRFPVSWDGVDVFILCFSLANRESLRSAVNYWAPLARRIHGIDVPLVLCGTMCDVNEFEVMSEDIREAVEHLSRIRNTPYVEISSKTSVNVEQLITISLETVSPTFFTQALFHEGPSLDMFRSLRQLGYDYDDDSEEEEM